MILWVDGAFYLPTSPQYLAMALVKVFNCYVVLKNKL